MIDFRRGSCGRIIFFSTATRWDVWKKHGKATIANTKSSAAVMNFVFLSWLFGKKLVNNRFWQNQYSKHQWKTSLGGGFNYFLFLPLPGEMIQFDYFIFFKWVETTS